MRGDTASVTSPEIVRAPERYGARLEMLRTEVTATTIQAALSATRMKPITLGDTPALRAPCVITLLRSWLTNQANATMTATSARVRIVSVGKLNIELFQCCSRNNDDKIAWSSKVWLLGGADG